MVAPEPFRSAVPQEWLTNVSPEIWADMPALVAAVQAAGDAIGLPFIAARLNAEPCPDAPERCKMLSAIIC